uniref:Uncharacterized protein n=1 Tax=Bursaphelenchus xylophilus TaxID=6326 RepID=A0A1I7SC57_BURXY
MRLAVEKRSLAIPRRRYFPDRLKEEGENLGSIVIYGYCPGRGPCAGDGMGRQKNRPLLEKKPESRMFGGVEEENNGSRGKRRLVIHVVRGTQGQFESWGSTAPLSRGKISFLTALALPKQEQSELPQQCLD